MAYTPQYFQASTMDVVNKALECGLMKYPGICYVTGLNTLVWITEQGTPECIADIGAITKADYSLGVLSFYNKNKLLFSVDIGMPEDIAQDVIDNITNKLDLTSYAKSKDVVQLLDNRVGDIEGALSVADFVNSRSYNAINDIPITQIQGSLAAAVDLSKLSNGVYKICGQFQICSNHTIQYSADSDLFSIEQTEDCVSITKLSSNSITIYSVFPTGDYIINKYITEEWIQTQDFITGSEVKEYVKLLMQDSVNDMVTTALNENLDKMLDDKLSGIDPKEIQALFNRI
ncbi:hypothetical protein C0033_07435 [Clostridium sp. chh4-2]|uniref:hypothetical protein n=1 Tax=Clostridium sp. chh4-2 TaxID=2067550 RepID=UPI000CCEC9B3|nr:hypothetical protein [Clostridium sp. chh4-2]PNV62841.1 hypothetical protein C0033_07435 [Clostridium sp. chh4-2]